MWGSLLGTVGFAAGLQCLTPTLLTRNLAVGFFTAFPTKRGRGQLPAVLVAFVMSKQNALTLAGNV